MSMPFFTGLHNQEGKPAVHHPMQDNPMKLASIWNNI